MSVSAASQQATHQTALEHLHELWQRCLYCLALLIAGGVVGYVFRQQLISFLQHPLHERLYYTSPMDSFNFVMQLCLLIGFIVALPVICYNILRFVEPALPKTLRKRTVFGVLIASYILALGGAAFAYYAVLPATLHFFGTIGGPSIQALISVNQYFSFVLSHVGLFAAVFQMPLLLLFVNYITPFGPGSLRKARKYIFVGSFAISLVIPMSPDPLSQASLALPVIVLFEVSVFLVWFVNRKKRRAAEVARQPQQRAQRVVSQPRSKKQPVPTTVSAKAQQPKPATAMAVKQKPRKTVDGFVAASRGSNASPAPRRNFQQPVRRPAPQPRMQPSKPQLISDMLT